MSKAEIIITQVPHGSSAAGEAKRGLDLYALASEEIVFSNSTAGDLGVTRWEWTLIETPPGSVALFSGADSAVASLQADVPGRYVVSLRVNDMGNDTPGYAITVAGVSFPSLGAAPWGDQLGDWDLPAFTERTFANWTDYYGPRNPYGAQRELWRILYQLRMYYLPYIGAGIPYVPFALPGSLVQRTDSGSWADAGYMRAFSLAGYTFDSIKFGCVLFREGTAGTAYARLYDVTHSVAITGSQLSTTGGPETLLTAALDVGNTDGKMRNDVATLYKVQICITGGVLGNDYVNLYDAYLQFVNT